MLYFVFDGTNRYRYSDKGQTTIRFNDKARATELLISLDESAIRVKSNPVSVEELEYIEGVRDIERGLAEYRRTGKTYAWDDIKAELGL